jgi:hypothetical protein
MTLKTQLADSFDARAARMPNWPRLMGERMAADYLSIGTTALREKAPKPKKIGGRSLWDVRDLDRFADSLGQATTSYQDEEAVAADVERRWLARRKL